jgi:hypothetical protein
MMRDASPISFILLDKIQYKDEQGAAEGEESSSTALRC